MKKKRHEARPGGLSKPLGKTREDPRTLVPKYRDMRIELEMLSEPVLRSLFRIMCAKDIDEMLGSEKDVEQGSSGKDMALKRHGRLADMVAKVATSTRTEPIPMVIHLAVMEWRPQEGQSIGKHGGIYIYCVDNKHLYTPSYETMIHIYHTRQEADAHSARLISNRLCLTISNYILGCSDRRDANTLRIDKLMVGKVSYSKGGKVHHSGMLQRFNQKYSSVGYTHMISLALFDPDRLSKQMNGMDVEKLALDVESDLHSYCRRVLKAHYDTGLSVASTGGMVKSNHEEKLYMVYLALACSPWPPPSKTERGEGDRLDKVLFGAAVWILRRMVRVLILDNARRRPRQSAVVLALVVFVVAGVLWKFVFI